MKSISRFISSFLVLCIHIFLGCSEQSQKFVQFIGNGWEAKITREDDIFSICAAIGCQSSGKSTLLNSLFQTSFPVGRGVGKATTKGVLAELQEATTERLYKAPLILLDVEGTESQGRGHLAQAFDERILESSAFVSDVLLVNLWTHDVGRQSLRSLLVPILRGVMRSASSVQNEDGKGIEGKAIVFVFRDMPENMDLETLADIIRNEIDSTLELSFNIPHAKLNSASSIFHYKGLCNYKIFPERFHLQCSKMLGEILPLVDAAADKTCLFAGTVQEFLSSSFAATAKTSQNSKEDWGSKTEVSSQQVAFSSLMDGVMKHCLQESEARIEKLQREVDLATITPLLNFGPRASDILKTICAEFDAQAHDQFPPVAKKHAGPIQSLITKRRNLLQAQLADLLEPCFLDHLCCLREYFQDTFQDHFSCVIPGTSEFEAHTKKLRTDCLERFENAASSSVPEELRDLWKYDLEVKWLADYMDEKIEDKRIEASLVFSSNDLGPKPMPRWKKVVIQALVLGINYLQATQGLRMARRDCLRREQKYPKFPLF